MTHVWFYTLASIIIVSLISLVGILTLSLKENVLKQALIYLVSFSAGGLIGDAFIHLLPEAVEKTGFGITISFYVISGIITFFIIEKLIRWRHCHIPNSQEHAHPFSLMILFGDAVHNFIDGLIIGASYLVSISLGVTTTLAVIFHEIPQEIGDFSVLLYGGFNKKRALLFNFLCGVTGILGAIIVLILKYYINGMTTFLIPFATGGFVYIASSDLIPELHKEVDIKRSALQLALFIAGVLVMFVLTFLE